jgi:hypothetical protein
MPSDVPEGCASQHAVNDLVDSYFPLMPPGHCDNDNDDDDDDDDDGNNSK